MTEKTSALDTYKQVFASRNMLAMLLLGFSSGFPLALSVAALQAWLTVEGLSIKTIGYFALVGLPYTFKFVWAPLMDRFEPTFAGRRRSWIMITQACMAVMCFAIAAIDPKTQTALIAATAAALAFFSASHDVVFDAYRADLLSAQERGAGGAITVVGYRIAMIISGGLVLIIADQWLGWPDTYRLCGVVLALLMLATWISPRLQNAVAPTTPVGTELRGFFSMVVVGAGVAITVLGWNVLGWDGLVPAIWRANKWASLVVDSVSIIGALTLAILAARKVGFPSFVTPWDAFMHQRNAVALLALIILYKLSDAFAMSLSTTFLIRGVGFSATEVGAVNKVFGLAATIVGALMGGAWLAKSTLYRSLMIFGILQGVSNLAYWVLAVTPRNYGSMALAIGFENLCGGLGTAAFLAFMMALTDKRFSAAQFALISALSAVGRVYVGPASGVMVEALGWPTFFLFTVVLALPGLVLLYLLKPTIEALGQEKT
jgi:MFS transporter, PAT family, beta-lactamase induction signal transducer AmpG